MIKKILIAIDGSESAINAAKYALFLSKKVHADVEIIYVIPNILGEIDASVLPVDVEAVEKKNTKKTIGLIKKEFPKVKINDIEVVGDPAKEINKVIDKFNADLLIIGHHTHNFIDKIFVGSVENQLLNKLKIPMLIVPFVPIGIKN